MIIDKFIFCTSLGKSGKESILNLEQNQEKEYIGGVGCGNHLNALGKK